MPLRNGQVVYSHQLLSGVIVSPQQKEVLPLCPEPIVRQDGQQKNNCERNAAKRFIEKVRQTHPNLPLVVIEDSLSSNAPHIELLQLRHNCIFPVQFCQQQCPSYSNPISFVEVTLRHLTF